MQQQQQQQQQQKQQQRVIDDTMSPPTIQCVYRQPQSNAASNRCNCVVVINSYRYHDDVTYVVTAVPDDAAAHPTISQESDEPRVLVECCTAGSDDDEVRYTFTAQVCTVVYQRLSPPSLPAIRWQRDDALVRHFVRDAEDDATDVKWYTLCDVLQHFASPSVEKTSAPGWECPLCYMQNSATGGVCISCETNNPDTSVVATTLQSVAVESPWRRTHRIEHNRIVVFTNSQLKAQILYHRMQSMRAASNALRLVPGLFLGTTQVDQFASAPSRTQPLLILSSAKHCTDSLFPRLHAAALAASNVVIFYDMPANVDLFQKYNAILESDAIADAPRSIVCLPADRKGFRFVASVESVYRHRFRPLLIPAIDDEDEGEEAESNDYDAADGGGGSCVASDSDAGGDPLQL
jgi:hypothetical protein